MGVGSEWGRDWPRPASPPKPSGRSTSTSSRRYQPLDGLICADDLATLDTLLHDDVPQSVLLRDDLTVRATRTVWLARRPK